MIPTEYLLCPLAETVCFVVMFKGCSTLLTVIQYQACGLLSELIIVQRELVLCLKVLQAELFAILLSFSGCAKQ